MGWLTCSIFNFFEDFFIQRFVVWSTLLHACDYNKKICYDLDVLTSSKMFCKA